MPSFEESESTFTTSKGVIAVIVSFNPQKKEFCELLAALLPQVTQAILIDNHSSPGIFSTILPLYFEQLEVVVMPENVGIAAAQNVGIERALAAGADYVFLSDQDSAPPPTLIAELLAAVNFARKDAAALPIAAAGPATVDCRTGHASFLMLENKGSPCRWYPPTDAAPLPAFIEVAFLIASGTLIPACVLKQLGVMRSSYFIDHVDTEWSFRAKNAGYRLLGVPASKLGHRLGDSVSNAWFFGARRVAVHPPLRDYYMFRNTIQMLRDTPMALRWKLYFLWRLVQFAGYFLVFTSDRWQRLKKMLLGLLHALLGVSGRLENDSRHCHPIVASMLEPRADRKTVGCRKPWKGES